MPGLAPIGTGVGNQNGAIAGFKDAKGGMLHAHRGNETADQDRVDIGGAQDIHETRVGGTGPRCLGQYDFSSLRCGEFFPLKFFGRRVTRHFGSHVTEFGGIVL